MELLQNGYALYNFYGRRKGERRIGCHPMTFCIRDSGIAPYCYGEADSFMSFMRI